MLAKFKRFLIELYYCNKTSPLFLDCRNDLDSISPTTYFPLILVTLYPSFSNLSHMLISRII